MNTINLSVGNEKLLQVLIVEDCETDYLIVLRQIQRNLSDATYHRVENRSQLIDALARPWNFIVTDYHLPDIEGTELLAAITKAQGKTPCILLSGSMVELESMATPDNVFAKLEKGDFVGLRNAILRIVQSDSATEK